MFQVIDEHAHDNQYGGYRIAFTADWQWIKDYKDGPNAAGSFGRKSYDWHLGLVEALATLYDVTGDAQVRARLEELLDLFVNKIIDADVGYGRYYFNDDGVSPIATVTPSNPNMVSIWKPVGSLRSFPDSGRCNGQAQTVRAIPARREE